MKYTVLVGKMTPYYQWEGGHETRPFEYLSYSPAKTVEKSQKSKPRLLGNFKNNSLSELNIFISFLKYLTYCFSVKIFSSVTLCR